MIVRLAVVSFVAVSCAGCANQGPLTPMGLGFHGQLEGTRPATGTLGPSAAPRSKMKQTLGGKILSAIALERVTGRKPDPRRFKELR